MLFRLSVILLLSLGVELGFAGPYSDPHFVGDRKVIVQLFEWKFSDVAKECEKFLGPNGYAAVQVSPVNENAALGNRPWYERYQPVSYKIETRSGNEQQFADMVHRCNKAGVRVIVDIVLNHMTMPAQGKGSGSSTYDGNNFNYPGVPFTADDFHRRESCPYDDLNIHNWDSVSECRNCQLFGLRDLNQAKENVRNKQAGFLNKMIDIGVVGFRSDSSKHQWPKDLENINSRLHHLNTSYFSANSKVFWCHEVVAIPPYTITDQEYTPLGRVMEFNYYKKLCATVRKQDGHKLADLKNFGQSWGMLATNDAVSFIDNHDLQRGHNGDLRVNIAYFDHKLLKMATVFMLAWPYGITRVMSSYSWNRNIVNNKDTNDWVGPPVDSNGRIVDVTTNSDNTCNKEWVCEHRWRQIASMAKFRNIVGDESITNWWDNGSNMIAFGRGRKGFVVINNDNKPLDQKLQTGLPAGQYCDILTADIKNGKCTGRMITVESDGKGLFKIDNTSEDSMIAIHIKSKV